MVNPHKRSVKESVVGAAWQAVSELWCWRRLVGDLARHEFKVRYAGSVLGMAWALLEPAVHFALYLAVFDVLLGTRLASAAGVEPFGLFLVCGLVSFMTLQEMLQRAVDLAREHAHLLRHVAVPVGVLVSGSLLAVLLRQAIAFGVVIAVCAAWGTVSLAAMPLTMLGVVVLVVGSWGVALVLVPVGAYLPDASQAIGLACSVLFFATPIVYREAIIPSALQPWLAVNPLVGVVELVRAGLVGGPVEPVRAVAASATALLWAGFGAWFLRRRALAVRDVV